jgi:hypothetical protein
MTKVEVNVLQAQYGLVAEAVRPLASKDGKSRHEAVALTHLETAMLWLGAHLQAARMMLKG